MHIVLTFRTEGIKRIKRIKICRTPFSLQTTFTTYQNLNVLGYLPRATRHSDGHKLSVLSQSEAIFTNYTQTIPYLFTNIIDFNTNKTLRKF